jgi:short subunit dehydrogenase-like uncharacterized protein
MNYRRDSFDLVIYGATGFTGTLVSQYALQVLDEKRVALAGRSREKLEELRNRLGKRCELFPVDAQDSEGLENLARKTKVLLNCAGPFCLFGLNIVQACIVAGTDYLDITGEPNFIDQLGIRQPEGNAIFESATQAGVLIIPACGFDSIPADLGTIFSIRVLEALLQQHTNETDVCLADIGVTVESFMRFHGPGSLSGGSISGLSAGTFYTIQESLRGRAEYRRRRHQRQAQVSLSTERNRSTDESIAAKPRLHYEKRKGLEGYALPLLSADQLIVRSTAKRLEAKAIQQAKLRGYSQYILLDSWFAVAKLSIQAAAVYALCHVGAVGKRILQSWKPDGFGPDEACRKQTRADVHFIAETTVRQKNSDRQVRVSVHTVCSTKEMYEVTAFLSVQAALCIIESRSKLLAKSGCFTCGSVFGNELLARLCHAQEQEADPMVAFRVLEQEFRTFD